MPIIKTIHGMYHGIAYTIELLDDAYAVAAPRTIDKHRQCTAQIAQRILLRQNHSLPALPGKNISEMQRFSSGNTDSK